MSIPQDHTGSLLYKEPNKWKYHLISYLEFFTNYGNHKLNEILKKEN